MKLSLRAKVANYLIANEDTKLTNQVIADGIGSTANQVSCAMYTLCKEADDIFKCGRAMWIYRPSEPVVPVLPLTHQLHDLLSKGRVARQQIADELGIELLEVSPLIGRMNNDLGCKAKSETYYTLK